MRREAETRSNQGGINDWHTHQDAAEECRKGQIETAQRLLQGMTAERDELGPVSLDLRQDVLLLVITDRLARFAPGVNAFFECRVGQLAVQSRPVIKPRRLRGIGIQLERDLAALHTGRLSGRMRSAKPKPPA